MYIKVLSFLWFENRKNVTSNALFGYYGEKFGQNLGKKTAKMIILKVFENIPQN